MRPRLYIGTVGMAVWFSDDLGETWTRPNSEHGLNNESRIWAMASHPERPGFILAGTDSGLYRWEEDGQAWSHIPTPLDNLHIWGAGYCAA